jgi:hypothetical protein
MWDQTMSEKLTEERDRLSGMLLRFGVSRGRKVERTRLASNLQDAGGTPKHLERLWRDAQSGKKPASLLATWLRDKEALADLVSAIDDDEADRQQTPTVGGQRQSREDAFEAVVWKHRDPALVAERYSISTERLLEILIEFGLGRTDPMYADEVQRHWTIAMNHHHPQADEQTEHGEKTL